ncbi:unnamed protein product [Ectocarpus sp. CCAP 1310/34]|nr:unnamed protein product [Ectocarpus sp. CCAP 1310/34]
MGRRERVKEAFADDGGRVVEVREGDPAPHLAKLREVERLMDADMGFAPGARDDAVSLGSASPLLGEGGAGARRGRGGRGSMPGGGGCGGSGVGAAAKTKGVTAFLYVREKRVLGCVIAQRIDTARRAVVLPEPGPKKTEVAAAVGSGLKPSVVAPPPLTHHFARIGDIKSSPAAAASTGVVQREAKSFVAGAISGEHDPRPRQEEQQAPRSAEGGRCCVSPSKGGEVASSPARSPLGVTAAPPRDETGSSAGAGPRRQPSSLDGSSGVGGGEAGVVAGEEAAVTGKKRRDSDGGGGGSATVAATAGCAAAATAGASPSVEAVAAAARSSLKRKKLQRGDAEGAARPQSGVPETLTGGAAASPPPQDEPESASSAAVVQLEDGGLDRDFTSAAGGRHRPVRSDFQDLRAWTAGKAASAEAAGRLGPVGDREARASCTSEEISANEEKTMAPVVAGGSYSCGGGGGEGVRVAEVGPGSAAGGGEGGGGGGGGLRLAPPLPSVAGTPAAAAGAAEVKRVFVRKSPWSRPPVVRAPSAGPARGGRAGPTPLAAELTATAGTAVPSPRPKRAAAAGGRGLLSDSGGGAAAEGRDAGDRCHPSPRGAVAGGGGGDGRTRHEADRHSGEARHPAHGPLSFGGTGTGGAGSPAEYSRGSDSDHGTTGRGVIATAFAARSATAAAAAAAAAGVVALVVGGLRGFGGFVPLLPPRGGGGGGRATATAADDGADLRGQGDEGGGGDTAGDDLIGRSVVEAAAVGSSSQYHQGGGTCVGTERGRGSARGTGVEFSRRQNKSENDKAM